MYKNIFVIQILLLALMISPVMAEKAVEPLKVKKKKSLYKGEQNPGLSLITKRVSKKNLQAESGSSDDKPRDIAEDLIRASIKIRQPSDAKKTNSQMQVEESLRVLSRVDQDSGGENVDSQQGVSQQTYNKKQTDGDETPSGPDLNQAVKEGVSAKNDLAQKRKSAGQSAKFISELEEMLHQIPLTTETSFVRSVDEETLEEIRAHALSSKASTASGDSKIIEDISELKQNRYKFTDWYESVQTGLISPHATISGKPDPKNKEEQTYNLVILRSGRKTRTTPVIFPHEAHTYWHSCKNCHTGIFPKKKAALKISSMRKIYKGQFCGVCHGTVAFPVKQCKLCHIDKRSYRESIKHSKKK